MMRLIREHSALNGLRFTVIEFLVMALAVVDYAICLVNAGAIVLSIALIGVGANCLAVAAVGIRSLQAGEQDRRLGATFSPASRARVRPSSRSPSLRLGSLVAGMLCPPVAPAGMIGVP